MPNGPGSEDTLAGALEGYVRAGFAGQFGARAGGLVRCFSCNAETPAGRVPLCALHRLEGASDPADEVAVAALRCPACGAKGTVALTYGPGATPEDAVVLHDLQDRRHLAGIRPGI